MSWINKVRSGLKQKGYRQLDLAVRLGVSEGAVSNYLKGKREPSLEVFKEIAKMIEVPVSELLGDDAKFIGNKDQIEAAQIIMELPEDKREMALKMLRALKSDD